MTRVLEAGRDIALEAGGTNSAPSLVAAISRRTARRKGDSTKEMHKATKEEEESRRRRACVCMSEEEWLVRKKEDATKCEQKDQTGLRIITRGSRRRLTEGTL